MDNFNDSSHLFAKLMGQIIDAVQVEGIHLVAGFGTWSLALFRTLCRLLVGIFRTRSGRVILLGGGGFGGAPI